MKESIKVDPVNLRAESDYCLILSDLNMPIMDGYEFAEKLNNMMTKYRITKTRRPKLVAVTGNVERAFIERCFECDFDQVYSKPITSDSIAILALEQSLKIELR